MRWDITGKRLDHGLQAPQSEVSPMSQWAWASTHWPCRPSTNRTLNGGNGNLTLHGHYFALCSYGTRKFEWGQVIESGESQNEILKLISWAARGHSKVWAGMWQVSVTPEEDSLGPLLRNWALPQWPGMPQLEASDPCFSNSAPLKFPHVFSPWANWQRKELVRQWLWIIRD